MKDLPRKRGIHVNPWQHFPRLITSIDFIKRDRPLKTRMLLIAVRLNFPWFLYDRAVGETDKFLEIQPTAPLLYPYWFLMSFRQNHAQNHGLQLVNFYVANVSIILT